MSSKIINTKINYIIKRDGGLQDFNQNKITNAIYKSMHSLEKKFTKKDAEDISNLVVKNLEEKIKEQNDLKKNHTLNKKLESGTFHIEYIQNIVEEELMKNEYFEVAKAYILYREERRKEREKSIFKKRLHLKPFEYPNLYEYVNAIRHSYWVHTEFDFVADMQDFRVNINEKEKNALKNTILAIAQIEVSVKTFWGKIYDKMPKPEIAAVGFTFAESEVRHMDAYSHLLEILNLNEEFKNIKNVPAILDRIHYLDKSLQNSKSEDNKAYSMSILMFSLFIEHVSLFSQFLIIMSFNKFKNIFKGISNVVEATSKEEQIHGFFGIDIIKTIQKENPDWFDAEHKEKVLELCREAFEAEKEIVDWIFEKGELDFLSKNTILEFIKNRFNNSLISIGMKEIFEVDKKIVKETNWFEEEITSTKHVDFFVKKSINYNKRSQSFSAESLF